MSSPTTLVADRYRLVKLIGSGGMGVVWHAWDERLHRDVALKMLRTQPDLSDREREAATDRAMREARITAGLHHPHAVTVFDVVEHEGQPCIVMQLVESTPLSALLRERGTLSPRETARIGAEVGSALAAAHKLRIVHRDVKPGNILVTEDGSAMISDFGISHALGDTTITATGMVHGTPAFLAPEVAQGKPTSFASDVFSLGSTMYTMLEGRPPFGADPNPLALLHRGARGDFPAPQRAGALDPLLRSMLASDPRRRPSMKTIAARLAAMHEGTTDAAASELPTVPFAAAASAADPPTVAGTERLDEASGSAAGADARTDAVATERLDEASGSDPAADARTVTTERLHPAAPPALAWLLQPSAASDAAGTPAEPPRDAPPAHAGRAPRRRGPVVATVVVLCLLLAGGAIVLGTLFSNAGNVGAAPEAGESSTPAPASSSATPSPEPAPQPAQEPSPSPSAEPTPTPTPSPQPATPEQRVVETLSAYYGLVPADLDTAWTMMTADYQENHVGGRAAYEEFWSAVAALHISDVTATAPDQGQATLTYTFTDGAVVQEVTAYRLVDEGGVMKIAATEVLSSVAL